jgi:hypothetical protein
MTASAMPNTSPVCVTYHGRADVVRSGRLLWTVITPHSEGTRVTIYQLKPSPRAPRSPRAGRRFRVSFARASARTSSALMSIVFLAGCERSPVNLGASAEEMPPRQEKLAEVDMQFDLGSGTIHTTVRPVSRAGKLDRGQMFPSGPRMASSVNARLTMRSILCDRCVDGVLGMHGITVLLQNTGDSHITNVTAFANCVGCAMIDGAPQVMWTPATSPLDVAQSYTQYIFAYAAQQRFTVSLMIYGDV